jgi:hypothetical protein
MYNYKLMNCYVFRCEGVSFKFKLLKCSSDKSTDPISSEEITDQISSEFDPRRDHRSDQFTKDHNWVREKFNVDFSQQ